MWESPPILITASGSMVSRNYFIRKDLTPDKKPGQGRGKSKDGPEKRNWHLLINGQKSRCEFTLSGAEGSLSRGANHECNRSPNRLLNE